MTTIVTPYERERGRFMAGVMSWVTTTDHKKLGILYIVTGLIFFALAGTMALLMRVQLAVPNNTFLSSSTYNELYSLHGVTMIFLFVIPVLTGVGNYFVPLMVGARDIAFPRVNSFGFWLVPAGGFLIEAGLLLSTGGPVAGWTEYPPVSTVTNALSSAGHGTDLWAMGIIVLGVSSIMASVNFLATIATMRAKGMTWLRMPVFVWTVFFTSLLILCAVPSLTTATILTFMDRNLGTQYFTGNLGMPVLYQHLFWFYSHPAVYIMIMPFFGAISEVMPVFTRKPLFGYTSMIFATGFIALFGFLVWAHHMFTVGLSPWWETYFMAASMVIAVPTGVKIFNWVATAWNGSLNFRPPLYFVFGFLSMFLVGGITGIFLASVPADQQLHQSYFIVAHMHYVLFGGSVFAMFAGMYYWFPKMTGRLMNETWGKAHFWLMLLGFNLAFMPMHALGVEGMPRRIATWSNPDWAADNLISTIGAFILAFSILVFLINFVRSWRSGEPAGNDPWDGNTLEWTTTSPPPHYNFGVIPEVHSRHPAKDLREAKG